MLINNRGRLFDLLVFVGIVCLFLGTAACNAQDKSDDTKNLVKERRDLLGEAVERMNKLETGGIKIPITERLQSERDLLKADLDWFDKPEDRMQAINKHREAADLILRNAKKMVNAGRVDEYVALQARAYVVEVQIEFLKEKRRAKSGK